MIVFGCFQIVGARPFKHLKTSTAHILFLMRFIDGSFTLFLLPFIIFNDRIWMLSNRWRKTVQALKDLDCTYSISDVVY